MARKKKGDIMSKGYVTTPHVFESNPEKLRIVKRVAVGEITLGPRRALLLGIASVPRNEPDSPDEEYREYIVPGPLERSLSSVLQSKDPSGI